MDLPVDEFLMDMLRDSTGVKGQDRFSAAESQDPKVTTLQELSKEANNNVEQFALFRKGVAFLDTQLWPSGEPRLAAISLSYDVRELWDRVSRVQSRRVQFGGATIAQLFVVILAIVAVLFLIIQGWRSSWVSRWRGRSRARFTSCSRGRSAFATATSRIASTSTPRTSSASWRSRSTR